MNRLAAVALAISFASPLSAFAQVPVAQEKCDVAVWTSPEIKSNRMGLFLSGYLKDFLQKPEQKELNSKDALTSFFTDQFLMGIVESSDLPKLIKRDVRYIHAGSGVENRVSAEKSKVRSSESKELCYIEVFINEIAYNSDPIWGEELQGFYWIKDFRGSRMKKYLGIDSIKMNKFTGASVEGGVEKLKTALLASFNESIGKKLATK